MHARGQRARVAMDEHLVMDYLKAESCTAGSCIAPSRGRRAQLDIDHLRIKHLTEQPEPAAACLTLVTGAILAAARTTPARTGFASTSCQGPDP